MDAPRAGWCGQLDVATEETHAVQVHVRTRAGDADPCAQQPERMHRMGAREHPVLSRESPRAPQPPAWVGGGRWLARCEHPQRTAAVELTHGESRLPQRTQLCGAVEREVGSLRGPHGERCARRVRIGRQSVEPVTVHAHATGRRACRMRL